jgi:hypothetical protein
VDETFSEFVLETVTKHDPTTPIFLFWAPHIVHSPLQVPKEYLDLFGFIPDWRRRRYHAMVAYMDSKVGMLVNLLKQKGMHVDDFHSNLRTFHRVLLGDSTGSHRRQERNCDSAIALRRMLAASLSNAHHFSCSSPFPEEGSAASMRAAIATVHSGSESSKRTTADHVGQCVAMCTHVTDTFERFQV